jgi:hypothetical protein
MRYFAGAMNPSPNSQQLLCERRRPMILPRPALTTTFAPKRELRLATSAGDLDSALCHHLDQVPVRQPIRGVPPHAQIDNVGVKGALTAGRGLSAASFDASEKELRSLPSIPH